MTLRLEAQFACQDESGVFLRSATSCAGDPAARSQRHPAKSGGNALSDIFRESSSTPVTFVLPDLGITRKDTNNSTNQASRYRRATS